MFETSEKKRLSSDQLMSERARKNEMSMNERNDPRQGLILHTSLITNNDSDAAQASASSAATESASELDSRPKRKTLGSVKVKKWF